MSVECLLFIVLLHSFTFSTLSSEFSSYSWNPYDTRDNIILCVSQLENSSEIMCASTNEVPEMPPLIPVSSIKFVKASNTHQKSKQIMIDSMEPNATEQDETDEASPIIINEPVFINMSEVSFRAHSQSLIIRLLSSGYPIFILERRLPRGMFYIARVGDDDHFSDIITQQSSISASIPTKTHLLVQCMKQTFSAS